MKHEYPAVDPIEVIESSRQTGLGIVRYGSDEQLEQFIASLKRVAPYSQRSALSIAEVLYGQMRQYKEHPEIAAYFFRDALEKEQGLIITRWQDISQREATCLEILHSATHLKNAALPVIIAVSVRALCSFPDALVSSTYTLE